MSKLGIALIQTTSAVSLKKNFDKTLGLMARAVKGGAKIICTQELFKSPYFCQQESYDLFKLAEPVDAKAPVVRELSAFAKAHKAVVVASLFEKRAEGVYHNTAAVLDADGKYLGKYRKVHRCGSCPR